MIEMNLSFNLRMGGSRNGDDNTSLTSKIKAWFEVKSQLLGDFFTYLKNDDPINYRITYDEGNDAYMILYHRHFSEGFYHRAENKSEWFYKTHDKNGNSIAVFSNADTTEAGTVQKMEGFQMVPTEILQSKSIAEIFITNCAEANIDPYIPLRVEFDEFGNGYTHYGRFSKFEVDPAFTPADYDMEIRSIEEWLSKQEEDEIDLIHIDQINRLNEIQEAIEKTKGRRRKRVHSERG